MGTPTEQAEEPEREGGKAEGGSHVMTHCRERKWKPQLCATLTTSITMPIDFTVFLLIRRTVNNNGTCTVRELFIKDFKQSTWSCSPI